MFLWGKRREIFCCVTCGYNGTISGLLFLLLFSCAPVSFLRFGKEMRCSSTQWPSPSERAGKVWEPVDSGGLAISFFSLQELARQNSSLWLHSYFFPVAYLWWQYSEANQHLEATVIPQFFHQRQRGFLSIFPVPKLNKYLTNNNVINPSYPSSTDIFTPS